MGGHTLEKKRCGQCGRWKPRHLFHVKRASPDGLQAKCKSCQLKANKASRDGAVYRILTFFDGLTDKKQKAAFAVFVRDHLPGWSSHWDIDAEIVKHLEVT